jgi:hypothetical protein
MYDQRSTLALALLGRANGKDARGVDYSRLTALLIEAVKQQQKQIAVQQSQIRKQQRDIAGLSRKVNVLESTMHSGQATKPTILASQLH